MKTQIIKIDSIVRKQELYPRTQVSWYVAYKYSEAMKAGAKFPPITVAFLDGKYILVDGWHRINAFKKNGETHTQAEVLKGIDEQQIYIEAVKRNDAHGFPLSAYELRKAALLMQKWGIEPIEISKAIRVPLDKMEMFVAKSITNIATGERIALKKSLEHLSSKTTLEVSDDVLHGGIQPIQDKPQDYEKDLQAVEMVQRTLGGRNQADIIDELILLIENNLLDLENEEVREGLNKLSTLLGIVLKAS